MPRFAHPFFDGENVTFPDPVHFPPNKSINEGNLYFVTGGAIDVFLAEDDASRASSRGNNTRRNNNRNGNHGNENDLEEIGEEGGEMGRIGRLTAGCYVDLLDYSYAENEWMILLL